MAAGSSSCRPQRPADAARQPALHRAGRGRGGAAHARQHSADELLAQLLAQRPLAGVLLQGRSPYTQMYLTHIDEEGNDSPAILIENSTAANRAVNLPEFVNIPPDGLLQRSMRRRPSSTPASIGPGNWPEGTVRRRDRGLAECPRTESRRCPGQQQSRLCPGAPGKVGGIHRMLGTRFAVQRPASRSAPKPGWGPGECRSGVAAQGQPWMKPCPFCAEPLN